jgi:SpoVK/Ycf46/Vps4 family AAA+-type ATPase
LVGGREAALAAAGELAAASGREVESVDLSRLVSKRIGETEKNLTAAFDRAEAGGAVLLLDEADALFGRRSGVSESRDRYANRVTDFLLDRMEEFDGLAIVRVESEKRLDRKRLRRFLFVVRLVDPE